MSDVYCKICNKNIVSTPYYDYEMNGVEYVCYTCSYTLKEPHPSNGYILTEYICCGECTFVFFHDTKNAFFWNGYDILKAWQLKELTHELAIEYLEEMKIYNVFM